MCSLKQPGFSQLKEVEISNGREEEGERGFQSTTATQQLLHLVFRQVISVVHFVGCRLVCFFLYCSPLKECKSLIFSACWNKHLTLEFKYCFAVELYGESHRGRYGYYGKSLICNTTRFML